MLDRPHRRRHPFLWPVTITMFVLAGLGLARINERASEGVRYLEEIRQSGASLVTPAASLAGLADRVGRVDRAEFLTVTSAIDEALAAAAATVEESPSNLELAGVASLYRTTIAAWRSGVASFSQGVIDLADGDPAGEDRLYLGLQEVAAGDSLYLQMISELDREEVPDPITPLPEVTFLPPDLSATNLARLFTIAARASNSLLALRADLAIVAVMAEPEWVANTEGELVVRETDLVTVNVVVANNGNAPAPAQAIDLELVNPDGSQLVNQQVTGLNPGGQTTVSFPDLAVEPGGSYQLQVRLVVTIADADPTNNTQTLGFLVNEGAA
jgi:hypothetical protein